MESNSSGDFNLLLCVIQVGVAQESVATVATMNLNQVVKGLTHKSNHTLDLGDFLFVCFKAIVRQFEG